MILVKVNNGGFDWFLKRTTWTSDPNRADKFQSVDQAKNAVNYAKKFMAAKILKNIEYAEFEF